MLILSLEKKLYCHSEQKNALKMFKNKVHKSASCGEHSWNVQFMNINQSNLHEHTL